MSTGLRVAWAVGHAAASLPSAAAHAACVTRAAFLLPPAHQQAPHSNFDHSQCSQFSEHLQQVQKPWPRVVRNHHWLAQLLLAAAGGFERTGGRHVFSAAFFTRSTVRTYALPAWLNRPRASSSAPLTCTDRSAQGGSSAG